MVRGPQSAAVRGGIADMLKAPAGHGGCRQKVGLASAVRITIGQPLRTGIVKPIFPETTTAVCMVPLAARSSTILVLALLATAAFAQPSARDADTAGASVAAGVASEDLPVFYVVGRQAPLRAGPGNGSTVGHLDFRRGVRVRVAEGEWRLVEDVESGRQIGWVQASALSNIWLLMDKPSRTLFVYQGDELIRRLPADVSMNPDANKVRLARGDTDHYRIPEGAYFVTNRNPNSEYYRSFMLNYPNISDAERGLAEGLISSAQYRIIKSANERFQTPPSGTMLGGAIAIHGQGSGRRRAWTRGCVALRDVHMDLLWDLVQVGTPVYIR